MKQKIKVLLAVLMCLIITWFLGSKVSHQKVYTPGQVEYSSQSETEQVEEVERDKYLTDPVPENKPKPVEPEAITINKERSFKVKLSITCETILNNIDLLEPAKWELVPKDGIIFPLQEVTAYEGESVFDVLLREVTNAKIHMEFEFTPMYNSAYIEGIHNLYEFDVGELSGWMYKVNGWFPNYGCSRYQVKEGDVIDWVYTCDLGRDIGNVYLEK